MWPKKLKTLLNFALLLLALIVVNVCAGESPPIYSLKSYGADAVRSLHVGEGRGKKKKYKKYHKPHHGGGHHGPSHHGHEPLELAMSIDLNMLAAAVGAVALLLVFAAVCYPFTHKRRQGSGWDRRSDSLDYDDGYYSQVQDSGQRVSLTSKILTAVDKLKDYYNKNKSPKGKFA